MGYLNQTFSALLSEGAFTREILGAAVDQLGDANYSSRGKYFLAFSGISTGLERLGKLVLMLDHYVDHSGAFPDQKAMKDEIGHDLGILYKKSQIVVLRRSLKLEFANSIVSPVCSEIIDLMSEFAKGDRYENINVLVGRPSGRDPIRSWYARVDTLIYDTVVSEKKKSTVAQNAKMTAAVLKPYSSVLHILEEGRETSDVEEASARSGILAAVSPYRKLYVLQIVRYWVELLCTLEVVARTLGKNEIPFFSELFAPFRCSDTILKRQKRWA